MSDMTSRGGETAGRGKGRGRGRGQAKGITADNPTTGLRPGIDPLCGAKGRDREVTARGRGYNKKRPDLMLTAQPAAPSCSNKRSSSALTTRSSKRVKKNDGSSQPAIDVQKTKIEEDLQLCSGVVKEMVGTKLTHLSWPFKKPVDAVRLGLTDYYEKIKNPMDLSTIKKKLDEKEYSSVEEFKQDFDLMISNCLSYNDPKDEVVELATQLKAVFVQRMSDIEKQSVVIVQTIQKPEFKATPEVVKAPPPPEVEDSSSTPNVTPIRPNIMAKPAKHGGLPPAKHGGLPPTITPPSQKSSYVAQPAAPEPVDPHKGTKRKAEVSPPVPTLPNAKECEDISSDDDSELGVKTSGDKAVNKGADDPPINPSKSKSDKPLAKRAAANPTATSSKADQNKPITLKDIYDIEKILVTLSNDKSTSLENRLYDALMAIPLDMERCSTEFLADWFDYLEQTIGADPSIILSTLLSATASQTNGAMVEVNAVKGHFSANNLYMMCIGEKGINKSGARDKIIKVLLEIEEDIVDGYRKDHDMHLAASKKAERTPTKDSSLKTPTKELKNISQGDSESSPTKEKPFNEQKARFILQSGTSEGMISSMMSSVHNDFVAEYDEGSVLLRMLWNRDGEPTTFASKLQSLYSSKETRVSNVRAGDRTLKNATLQIAAAVQPGIFLDSYVKDSRDAGGTVDRLILSVCKPVNTTLRQQDRNVLKMKKVNYPVKRLLHTVKEIHPTRNSKWPFSPKAKELLYQLNESMAKDAKQDQTGAIRPMNSKGLDKLCRMAMNLAAIRVCEEFMLKQDEACDEDIEFNEKNKIILVEDVKRSAHLVQHSNGVFWVCRQAAMEGSASATKENPVGNGGFTADMNDWKKTITETQEKHHHFEKVIGIYDFKKEDEENNADKVLLKDVVGDRKLYVRGSSKSGVSDKAACLHYFRVLEFNGLGKVLFGQKPDEGKVADITKNEYNKIRFQIYMEEEGMPANGSNIMQYIMLAFPDFKPFE